MQFEIIRTQWQPLSGSIGVTVAESVIVIRCVTFIISPGHLRLCFEEAPGVAGPTQITVSAHEFHGSAWDNASW